MRLAGSRTKTAKAKESQEGAGQQSRADCQESGDKDGSRALGVVCDVSAKTSDHVGREGGFRIVGRRCVVVLLRVCHSGRTFVSGQCVSGA